MTQSAAGGVKAQCSKRVYWDAWHSHPCANRGKVERDGKPYCSRHDPETVSARRAARNDKYEARRAANEALKEAALTRCEVLGGAPFFRWREGRYTGGVELTPEQADALIARLAP